MSQVSYTQDLRQEFEADTLRLLRRRFQWLLGLVATIYGLALVVTIASFVVIALGVDREIAAQRLIEVRGGYWGFLALLLIISADICVFLWCFREATARRNNRRQLLRLTFAFFVFRGIADLLAAFLLRTEGFAWYLGAYHVLACTLLPWTPMQALRPMFVLLPLHAALQFASAKHGVGGDIAWIIVACLLAVPGLLIAAFKTSRRAEEFKLRFLQDRYGQMRRELVDARRIHEALFPRPISEGSLTFSYRYEPMLQIGGDYLYARFSPPPLDRGEGEPVFNFLLIDVTGHGIAAALTVNRLYGEVERLFAEDPYASPADVLAALNRYVHLTLARHSVFATALCVRVDIENNRLDYASGGHPPAFLCGADGSIIDLSATAYVLGAAAPGEFDSGMQTVRFSPGDSLIAYTDGAIEARNPEGRMLGVFGFQKALAACLAGRSELTAQLLRIVEQHREGPPADDTLFVEITRRIQERPSIEAVAMPNAASATAGAERAKSSTPASRG
ncbi:MAG: serine/threonine-protein phosphatase [Phycisphaerales bacterium]|nr:serine/threonine-protein phosphatase [Phycisphaerales bacterium]